MYGLPFTDLHKPCSSFACMYGLYGFSGVEWIVACLLSVLALVTVENVGVAPVRQLGVGGTGCTGSQNAWCSKLVPSYTALTVDLTLDTVFKSTE